ncbi:hypothetical protein [Roseomonas sp. HF4]|uniref:hypothetical protein n=1 Tax=Roseomonas sp. HF4 TaxID=2562313 RepID=UPI0010BF9F98|nr:hypothetical protein [Roseomonas sp. HF4]
MQTDADRTPQPEQRPALELRKLAAEVDKLAAEVPKLRNDNRLLNRHAGAFVSVAAVLVGGATLANTYFVQREQARRTEIERTENTRRAAAAAQEQQRREEAEQRRLAAERSIRCVELGMRIVGFTREQIQAVGAARDRASVELIANTVIALFPPAEAAAILRAMRHDLPSAVMDEPAVQNAWREMLDQLEDSAPAGCERSPDLRIALPAPRGAVVAAAPASPAAPPRPAEGCPALPAPVANAERLTVFAQVVQEPDRPLARRILDRANAVDQDFSRAPIENVNARNPAAQAAEVRYYRTGQQEEAERLVGVIRHAACLEGLGGPLSALRAVFIGDRFRNLPAGRIELWFPRLAAPPA